MTEKIETMNKEQETIDVSSIKYLMDCIKKWELANRDKGGYVEFFGSFAILDEHLDYTEGQSFVYGTKQILLTVLEEMAKEIINESEDFIDW